MSLAHDNKAPLCYGRCACFSPKSKCCKNCGYSVECATQVLSRFEEISHDLDVSDLQTATQAFLDKNGAKRATKSTSSPKHVKARFAKSLKIQFEHPKSVDALPRRARMLAIAISRTGINMPLDAHEGFNRFPKSFRPNYIYHVQDLLCANGFTRERLKQCIRDHSRQSEAAVRTSCSATIRALEALNFIKLNGEVYEASGEH